MAQICGDSKVLIRLYFSKITGVIVGVWGPKYRLVSLYSLISRGHKGTDNLNMYQIHVGILGRCALCLEVLSSATNIL